MLTPASQAKKPILSFFLASEPDENESGGNRSNGVDSSAGSFLCSALAALHNSS